MAGAIKRLGYDGTTLDNVSANISGWPGWSGVYPTLYPVRQRLGAGDEELHRLRRAAAEGAGAVRARERGQAGPNDGSATKAWWTTLAPYVSGLLVEYFEQASDQVLFYNDPNNWHGYWESWLGLVDVAQNAGVDFYGGMKGSATDTDKMMYGKASFLLKWNGKRRRLLLADEPTPPRPLEPGLDDQHRHPQRPPATRSASAGAGTTPAAPRSSTPAPPPPRPSTSAPATKPPAAPASPPSPSNPPPP